MPTAQSASGLVFFDRGLIDAAAALQHLTGEAVLASLRHSHRYNRRVFMTSPWPEIYRVGDTRRHGFAVAVAECDRLSSIYPVLGYDVHFMPNTDVEIRADFAVDVAEPMIGTCQNARAGHPDRLKSGSHPLSAI